jgi:hypothetical protein
MIKYMMVNFFDNESQLRTAIAAAAARMIAQDGADYDSAKRRAARQLLQQPRAGALPDHAQIEQQVHLYNALFLADTQPARLRHLRETAVQLMQRLTPFQPLLIGAVWNGSAGQHDDIVLQLFADSAKEVELFLLDKNIQYDLSETPHFKGRRQAPVETVSFLWQSEGVHAALYSIDDLRGALQQKAGGVAALQALLGDSTHPTDRNTS